MGGQLGINDTMLKRISHWYSILGKNLLEVADATSHPQYTRITFNVVVGDSKRQIFKNIVGYILKDKINTFIAGYKSSFQSNLIKFYPKNGVMYMFYNAGSTDRISICLISYNSSGKVISDSNPSSNGYTEVSEEV